MLMSRSTPQPRSHATPSGGRITAAMIYAGGSQTCPVEDRSASAPLDPRTPFTSTAQPRPRNETH